MAMTNALAPGSISRATRRSAASMSPLNVFEVAVVGRLRHRAHPVTVGCGRRARRYRACQGPHPAAAARLRGRRRPGCAGGVSTPPSAIRWCGAASVTVVVTMSPGRISAPAGVEVHQPAVARPPGHPGGAGILAAFAGGHQQLDGAPDLGGVLLQRDPFLQLDQPLIAFLHNGFRHLPVQLGGRGAGPLGVLEGERAREPRLRPPRRAWPGSPLRSHPGSRRSGRW